MCEKCKTNPPSVLSRRVCKSEVLTLGLDEGMAQPVLYVHGDEAKKEVFFQVTIVDEADADAHAYKGHIVTAAFVMSVDEAKTLASKLVSAYSRHIKG